MGTPLVLAHDGIVYHVAAVARGPREVSSGADHTVRIWRADGVGEAEVLRGHLGYFDADATLAITSSREGTTRVWMRTWRGLVDHLASSTTACLTSEERQRLLGEKIADANADCVSGVARP